MKFIEFDRNKCEECYRCLRICPTKSIAFTGERRIVDEMCIKCGRCQERCPNQALTIQNDSVKIQKELTGQREMVVSLAPSFAGAFEMDAPGQLVAALRKLGFHYIEETAEGAELVSWRYEEEIHNAQMDNIITTCCPSATYLIEQYYPQHMDKMIPVVSPMILHGRILKERYGAQCYTVFIGPCLAKKAEAEELVGAIDAVLTFNELGEWLERSGICLKDQPESSFDNHAHQRGRAYPLGSSTRKSDLRPRIESSYKFMRVEGIDRCREILESLERGVLNHYCIEMNICSGSCINGPDLPKSCGNYYERENRVHCYAAESKPAQKPLKLMTKDGIVPRFERAFHDKSYHSPVPTEAELESILNAMGKYSEAEHLNCGACGYFSCTDKAKAVFAGISDIHMCLPFLRSKAESLRTTIFEHTPNAVLILDETFCIVEVNPSFQRIFGTGSRDLKGFPIYAFIDIDIFESVRDSGAELLGHKLRIDNIEREFIINVVFLGAEKVFVATLTDVTLDEKNRRELMRIKEKTVLACQEVIDKQMRVAQEIASLLGETTAETKVNLNRIKDIMLHQEEGQK